MKIIVVGGGAGGLTAAAYLAQKNHEVSLLEARDSVGGLASGFELDGLSFDAGPYILLDRPGLSWSFSQLGLSLDEALTLRGIEEVYQVRFEDGPTVRFYADRERTADGLEQLWPGSGARYLRFVKRAIKAHERLRPLQFIARPGPADLLRTGAWRDLSILLRPLSAALRSARLPEQATRAAAIWTYVAGQRLSNAPGPVALVPGLIHAEGAYYPLGGVRQIPKVLEDCALRAGVQLRTSTKVQRLLIEHGRATGVRTEEGETLEADRIISGASGIGTYLELSGEGNVPKKARTKLEQLPLQSPGVSAYLKLKAPLDAPYLRFWLPNRDEPCRLLLMPAVMEPKLQKEGWAPARLLAPLWHEEASDAGAAEKHLEQVLQEPWWRAHIEDFQVLEKRLPIDWGRAFHLYKNSMNPAMTARLMRQGRLAHRSPYIKGLYLAGSATHPGQWVSFCAVSGILAAELLLQDGP